MGDPLDDTTVKPAPIGPGEGEPPLMTLLTVVQHPDVQRVGERCPLVQPGAVVAISRREPHFSPRVGVAGAPLSHAALSRTPFTVELLESGRVRIDNGSGVQLAIDGEPVVASRTFTPHQLASGVVLEVAGSVTLLLHRQLAASPQAPESGLLGISAAIEHVRTRVANAAPHTVPVLIRGESGTGKELVAKAIHHCSERADGPFVAVNIAAIPAAMAAASLFGHVKGAFTGAVQASRGVFGAADGGTLFLDEVGETPPEVQVALLRALETGEIQPVGAGRAHKVDVRLIAATDAELERVVDDGRFRLPLMMRLAGYELHVPALRERRDDIAVLLYHFLRTELAAAGREELLADERWLSSPVVAALVRYDWPGNVRQLRNVARQLVIDYVGADSVPLTAVRELIRVGGPVSEPPNDAPSKTRKRRKTREIDDDEIAAALQAHGYRPGKAATALGVSRNTLYALMRASPRFHIASELERGTIEQALASSDGSLSGAARQLTVSERALQLRMRALGLDES